MGSMLNLGIGEADKDDDEFDEDNFR
jgi:hypothetical protein